MSMQDYEAIPLRALKQLTAKAKELTEDQRKRLGRAANSVWDEIGGDCLQAMEECGEARRGRATMPRSHVIEMVVDANRLEMELGEHFAGRTPKGDENKDLIEWMQNAPYKEIVKALKPAFPFKTYGW